MAANRRYLFLALTLLGCGSSIKEAALKVTVTRGPDATSKCIQVVVRTPAGAETRSTPIDFDGKQSAVIGVVQGAFPSTVTLYAVGYSDTACMTVAAPVERADETSGAFTKGKVVDVALTLTVRPMAKDDDNDGYISAMTGGDDCNDMDPAVHPGAVEICNNHQDDDCANGADCADPTCDLKECGPVTGAECVSHACAEAVCDDGIDNNDDGLLDCADPGCAGKACKNGGTCTALSCQHTGSEKGLCDDGIDNDGDGKIDCLDSDCLAETCTLGNKCITGMTCDATMSCSGGTSVTCSHPPNGCFGFAGSCNPADGGCTYPPNVGAACDDSNLCTGPDQCSDAGVCGGAPAACPSPNPCLRSSGCSAQTGCEFVAAPGHACDDSNPCTGNDTCLADAGCVGTLSPCAAPDCQMNVSCTLDGGCVFAPLDAGTNCDAGVCNSGGTCIAAFPYPPSNFTESQVPTPLGPVTLDCGITTVNTALSDGGVGFDNWCGGAPAWTVVPQPSGPDAVLISADGFTLAADGGLQVNGTRPLIIASLKGIDVVGKLRTTAGAQACTGTGAGGAVNADKGAGGGGFGTAGKNGGDTGSAGGAAIATNLVPLRGGCPGGGKGGIGGVGGGAIQLSAALNLNVTGIISAPGKLGSGGGAGDGAAAGGSGGAVLLEGLTVLIGPAAILATNGGSGGQGGGNLFGGDDGKDGSDDATPASGGDNVLIVGGAGGDGAAGTTDATAGHDGSAGGNGGGGGGGFGRIQLNTATTCSLGGGVLGGVVGSNQADAGCM